MISASQTGPILRNVSEPGNLARLRQSLTGTLPLPRNKLQELLQSLSDRHSDTKGEALGDPGAGSVGQT